MASLSLSLVELMLLLLGAVVLGITVHFFITSRRRLNETSANLQKKNSATDEWKFRYLNDIEKKDIELAAMQKKLDQLNEENELMVIDAKEMRLQRKEMEDEFKKMQAAPPEMPGAKESSDKGLRSQLENALHGLEEHQQRVGRLLGNLDVLSEKEEQLSEALHSNEELKEMLGKTQYDLSVKQEEIASIQQQAGMTKELKMMLDSAYHEFNVLQGKMLKMETQLRNSQEVNLELEDLKEENMRISRDLAEYKNRTQALHTENEQMKSELWESNEKLAEANLQRQQMSRKITLLEELNDDLNVVSEANKKLEGQLRKIGELESKLHIVEQERDNLKERFVS